MVAVVMTTSAPINLQHCEVHGNGEARTVKAEGQKGVEVLAEGRSPSHQLRGLGEHCKLRQWGLEQSPGDLAIYNVL